MDLVIHPELHTLCPPLTVDERMGLEESLLAEGCRDALAVWDDGEHLILLDGHNRFEFCHRYDLPFAVIVIETVHSLIEAKIWVIKNQFGRRNLTAYQRGEMALQLEPLITAQAKSNQGTRTDLSANLPESGTPVETREELATMAGISARTMGKVQVIAREADESTKQALRTGERSIHSVYVDLRPTHPRREEESTPVDVWFKLVRDLSVLVDSLAEQGGIATLAPRWSTEGQALLLGELEELIAPLLALRDELRAVCGTVNLGEEGPA